MSYELHWFCEGCGAHKRRVPFADKGWPLNSSRICRKCGKEAGTKSAVARERFRSWWDWRLIWLSPEGERVDVPASLTGTEESK